MYCFMHVAVFFLQGEFSRGTNRDEDAIAIRSPPFALGVKLAYLVITKRLESSNHRLILQSQFNGSRRVTTRKKTIQIHDRSV